jgi:drug/metabolite transporter (DMT)-like permease
MFMAVSHGHQADYVWPGHTEAVAWVVLIWLGIGPWTTGEITQIEAQARISPSYGQIILAMDPLISVALAAIVSAAGLMSSTEQHLGVRGWIGGAMLVVACLIASWGDVKAH